MVIRQAAVVLVLLFAAPSAMASGLYFTENGSKALIQGGAFTAQADDLTAIQHNPAGLALQPGFSFIAEGQAFALNVTFQRQDPGFDPANPSTLVTPSKNSDTPNLLPFVAVGYGFRVGSRTLTIAGGAYAPPAARVTTFAQPNYERTDTGGYVLDPRRNAGHRYMLISQDLLIAYPTLSVAIDVHPKVLVGVSAQLIVSHFKVDTAIYSGLSTPASFTQEDPTYDSTIGIDLPGRLGVTGIIGVLVRPIEQLQFGASFRPPYPVRASGKFSVGLGEFARTVGVTVAGDQAELAFNMPFELRLGARAQPIKRLGINLDVVWQGWSAFDEEVLTPQGVTLGIGNQEPVPVPAFHLQKRWRNTVSVRLGGGFEVVKQLTVHAGAWYETQAASDEYFNVDFAHAERVFFTAGASLHLGPIDLVAGAGFTPTVTKSITQSSVRASTSDQSVTGAITGAGVFTTGGWMATLGVRGRFEPKPPAAEKNVQ